MLPPHGGRKTSAQEYIKINSKYLFICGGAFVGLNEIVQRRLGKGILVSGSDPGMGPSVATASFGRSTGGFGALRHDSRICRTAPVVPCWRIAGIGLVRILTEPKHAMIRQYQS
jgi:ATP-dependent Clp protease ATP-binding subunit ClpX